MEFNRNNGHLTATIIDFRQLIGYQVHDADDDRIGVVDAVWPGFEGKTAFLGIRLGLIGLSRMRAVPLTFAVSIDPQKKRLGFGFQARVIKDAPAFDGEFEFTEEAEAKVYDYYRSQGVIAAND